MVRIGAIYSGVSYQKFLLDTKEAASIEPTYICSLSEMDFGLFDILLILRGSDQEILLRNRDKLIDFLNSGKILICFGETFTNWLPYYEWKFDLEHDIGPYKFVVDHPILGGLKPEDVEFHSDRTCSHGHYIPPKNAKVFVETLDGKAVGIIDNTSFKGTLVLMSTLDVDCHAGLGNQKAKKAFSNILRWAKNQVKRRE